MKAFRQRKLRVKGSSSLIDQINCELENIRLSHLDAFFNPAFGLSSTGLVSVLSDSLFTIVGYHELSPKMVLCFYISAHVTCSYVRCRQHIYQLVGSFRHLSKRPSLYIKSIKTMTLKALLVC